MILESKIKFNELAFQRLRKHMIWGSFGCSTNEKEIGVQSDPPWQIHIPEFLRPYLIQKSLGGKKYILVLVDEFTRFTSVEFVRKKLQVPVILINLLKRLQVLHGFRLENSKVIMAQKFEIDDCLTSVGITHNFSAPRTHQQNVVVEGKNSTIVVGARTMLNGSGLPLTLWAEAVSPTCYTQNRSLIVKRIAKTPYHLLYGKRPSIKYFHAFGCKCYVINDREPLGKFQDKSDEAFLWDILDTFQITSEKITKQLKTQEEQSQDGSISKDLEELFTEWYVMACQKIREPLPHPPEPLMTKFKQMKQVHQPQINPHHPLLNIYKPHQWSLHLRNIQLKKPQKFYQLLSLQELHSTFNLPQAVKWTKEHPQSQIIGDPSDGVKTRATANFCLCSCFVNEIEPKKMVDAIADAFWVEAMQDELL
ncbi:LOW QUALITY PROTEIN: hypothetical protein OSB04_024114 [Centaurea solstitialis]|uniref:Integrase catalytic domain-containing protein n=1 Tax=Centaurea solstitialis TaxID=347529 RepID=A0AA38T3Y9_9ASTR|nr:LOW QUALITY PROTEIN: hypothetical protein OSB04_024114 [Centaurea solstitialis]